MKRKVFYGIALVAALSSCTKDASVENGNTSSAENGTLNPDAPVAIKLGAFGEITAGVEKSSRAVIGAWNDTKIGIFALSTAGGWGSPVDASNPTVLWNNVEGSVESSNAVTVTTGDQPGYYPNGGTLNYSFYGYCLTDAPAAITDWGTPTVSAQTVTTTFTIDGTNDILWGKAEATQLPGKDGDENQYDGYNATYFRKGNGAATPDMKFGHLLTKLQFKINKSATFDAGQELYLKSITIKQVPTQFDLTIADVSGSGNAGKIVPNADPVNADLAVSGISDDGIAINTLDGFTDAGSPIMLYTDGSNIKTYDVEVVLAGGTDPGSPTSTNKLTIAAPASGAYLAGNGYTVNLTINSLQKIEVKATLALWIESDTPIKGEI